MADKAYLRWQSHEIVSGIAVLLSLLFAAPLQSSPVAMI